MNTVCFVLWNFDCYTCLCSHIIILPYLFVMSDLGQRRWSGSLTIQFIIYAMTDNEEKMAMYLYMADTQPRSIGKWKSH